MDYKFRPPPVRHHLSKRSKEKIKKVFQNIEDTAGIVSDIEDKIQFCIGFKNHLKNKAIRPWQYRKVSLNTRIILCMDIAEIFKRYTEVDASYTYSHRTGRPDGPFVSLLCIAYEEAGIPVSIETIKADIRRYRLSLKLFTK